MMPFVIMHHNTLYTSSIKLPSVIGYQYTNANSILIKVVETHFQKAQFVDAQESDQFAQGTPAQEDMQEGSPLGAASR